MMKSANKKPEACECNLCVHCKNNNYQAYCNALADRPKADAPSNQAVISSFISPIFTRPKATQSKNHIFIPGESAVSNDDKHETSGKPHGNMQLRVSSFNGMMVGFGVFTAIMLLAPALLITWMPIAIAVTAGVLFAAVDYGLNRQANKKPEEQSIQKPEAPTQVSKEVIATGSSGVLKNVCLY